MKIAPTNPRPPAHLDIRQPLRLGQQLIAGQAAKDQIGINRERGDGALRPARRPPSPSDS